MTKIQAFIFDVPRRLGLFTNLSHEIINVAWGVGIGLASQILALVIMLSLGYIEVQGFDAGIASRAQLCLDFTTSLSAAFKEELIFRLGLYSFLLLILGWCLGQLGRAIPQLSARSILMAKTILTVLIVGISFGWIHYLNEILNPGTYVNWSQMVWMYMVGGLVLTLARALSGSIWMPIVIHFIWNMGLGLLNLSGAPDHILDTQITGPAWVHVDDALAHWLLVVTTALGLAFYQRWQLSHDNQTLGERGA